MTLTSELPAVATAPRKGRKNNPEKTRENILQEAIVEFVTQGLSGARVDAIAERIQTSKRMIYYYFGSKEHLFVCVLEHTYEQFNKAESKLKLNLDAPEQALRDLVAFIWHYYVKHPEFVAILSIENLHQGKHAQQSGEMRRLSGEAVGVLRPIIEAGQAQGVFRLDVDLKHVYLMIASLCYFYNSNRHTLSSFLGEDLANRGQQQDWLGFISDLVLRGVTP